MKIYNDFNVENKNLRTITIGNFDGIHIGHQKLIEKTKSVASHNNHKLSLLTFSTHTSNITENKIKLICNSKQKIEVFRRNGIDEVFLIEFNENIKSMTTKKFIEDILIEKLNVKNIVLGDDAILGSDRLDIKGIADICNSYAISLHYLDNVEVDGLRVTSTLIREMLSNGIVGEELKRFLGRDYVLEGEVVHGNSFGRKLGFPTANINIDNNLIIPKYGVYYGICEIGDEKYKSGINIGYKPTVNNNFFAVEAFLLDFDKNIYGEKIKISLIEFLREEHKFNSIEELKKQIQSDIKYIKQKHG